MSSKTLGVLFIIILIYLVGALFFLTRQRFTSPSSQKSTITPTPTVFTFKQTKVELTSSGFSPKKVTIKKGTSVTWINKSDKTATINSADHPTHRRFPEMNLGEFDTNQMITHVFSKPGTYEYHNHYLPQETGTVIVVE